MSEFSVGDGVRHRDSGWAGHVVTVVPTDGPDLVSVRPTRPVPREIWDRRKQAFIKTPKKWPGWSVLSVYAPELVPFPEAVLLEQPMDAGEQT